MHHASLALTVPLAAVLAVLALFSASTALRTWSGSLSREGRLGLHTPAALESEAAFALANRVAAPLVATGAAIAFTCAVLVLALPIGVVGAVIVAVLGLVGLLWLLASASTLGEKAAMTVPRPARKRDDGGCCGACDCGGDGCGSGAGSGAGAGIPDLIPDATHATSGRL